MSKEEFTISYLPLAQLAGKKYRMDPLIILSQAAIESQWGGSYSARVRKNFFGVTAFGAKNAYWDGEYSESLNELKIKFRIYNTAQDSFYDFARLIASKYKSAHAVNNDVTRYAQAIAYSPYITESNGDNRQVYLNNLISSYRSITEILKKKESN